MKKARHWLASRSGLLTLLTLAALLGMLGITWQLYTPPPPPPPLLIAGGRLIQPLVAELAQRFSQQTGEEVQVEAGGSMAGMAAVKRGAIDIAMVGQPVPGLFSDPQTRQHLLARNSLAFIVHHQSPVRNLSQAQIRQVLTGQVRNWKTLGGPDAPRRRGCPALWLHRPPRHSLADESAGSERSRRECTEIP